ncbi:shikimate kinase [Thermonema rossianum]|uniref:shikimate kinase n=1 Tax=Thermonema rossianum TaxID=55505 RepID=UPI00056DC1B5|nr:shikimate kinase [Thermonema rossianum]
MVVYLIGMPGAGKTTCGMAWARSMGYKFYDMDVFIEALHGQSIPALFEASGEAQFREIERQVLHQISQGANRIIATGGGTPCFFDNMAFMKKNGLVVFLDCPLESIIQRLWHGRAQRPLLKECDTEERLRRFVIELYEKRRPFYEQAHLRLHQYDSNTFPAALRSAVRQ